MRKLIFKILLEVFSLSFVLIIASNYFVRMKIVENNFVSRSENVFKQIETTLILNDEQLDIYYQLFTKQTLSKAKEAAKLLELEPDAINSVDKLKEIADFLQVDEIHFFNTNGEIYAGTNPEYYGFNFDSGEQISFFKPMLSDYNMQLCQDITPNTAENKMMQYAAVWQSDHSYIIQIGLVPDRYLQTIQGKDLASLFSGFIVDAGSNLYAINADNKQIVGSTNINHMNLYADNINLDVSSKYHESKLSIQYIDDIRNYVVTYRIDDYILVRTSVSSVLMKQVLSDSITLAFYLLIIYILAILIITRVLDKKIIKSIDEINKSLDKIENDNINYEVRVDTTEEFMELSDHINSMVTNMFGFTQKISLVLDRVRIPIGILEYAYDSKKALTTSRVKYILNLDDDRFEYLIDHPKELDDMITSLPKIKIDNYDMVYQVNDNRFIRIESFYYDYSKLTVLIDITADVLAKKRLEKERDLDALTNIYNRKGFYHQLERIQKINVGLGAICLIDTDNLKLVNDNYGHDVGDVYLKQIASLLSQLENDNNIVARIGGDEFIVVLYNYASTSQLNTMIEDIIKLQNGHVLKVNDDLIIDLEFSLGIAYYPEDGKNFEELIKIADDKMYANKHERKS